MKKIILSILFMAFAIAVFSQNIKGYYVEAYSKLEAKRAFVINLDTFYATTQLSGLDTILVSREYLAAGLATKEPANANIQQHITNDADLVIGNEIQSLTRVADSLKLTSSAGIDLSDFAKDADLANYAPVSGSSNYIQNQNSSAQNANMWIDGTARIGGGGVGSGVASISVTKTLTSLNKHAFDDYSLLSPTSVGLGYSSFDASPSFNGVSSDHVTAYQSRINYAGSGILNFMNGLYIANAHNGAGTITDNKGIDIQDIGGTGSVSNNYGIYISPITRGNVDNYSIYARGSKSSFGGIDIYQGYLTTLDSQSKFGDQGLINGGSANGNTAISYYPSLNFIIQNGTTEVLKLNSSNNIIISNLAGTSTRLVTASSTGQLGAMGNGTGYLYNDGSGNYSYSTPASQTITLTGDVSGSGTTSITTTVADNSHNHNSTTAPGTYSSLVSLGGIGSTGSSLFLSAANTGGGTASGTSYFWFNDALDNSVLTGQFNGLNVNILSSGTAISGYVPTANGTGGITWAAPASSYTLPLAANGTRGGIQIGYTATGANLPLQLSSEKGYVSLTNSAIVAGLGFTPYDATNPNGYTSNTGTVTSVGMTVPTGFSISGSPITSSGTLGLTFASGYSLPTTASQSNWNTAYGWGNHSSAGYLTQSSFNSANADLAAIEAISGTTGLLRKTAANTWSLDNTPYLTANQTITLSGHVTGSGTTSISTTLANSSVSYAKLSAYGTPSNGDVLTYNTTYGLAWSTHNYVPTTRTLTINGTTYDLSANRTWTIAAGVSGSGNSGQVTYWNGTSSVTSSSSFTFNSGTGAVTATNFVLSSDRRLKRNIKPLKDLEWVDEIEFKQFKMKEYPNQLRYGVIAQEVEKVNDELVNTGEEGLKSVNYIDLLVAKVARQDEIIQTLLKRIEKLEENEK